MIRFPCSNARFSGLQGVFTPPLFQGDFAAGLFGFAVWGEKLASVSRFVAEIRPGQRQSWADDCRPALRGGTREGGFQNPPPQAHDFADMGGGALRKMPLHRATRSPLPRIRSAFAAEDARAEAPRASRATPYAQVSTYSARLVGSGTGSPSSFNPSM
jgi:hypothetical protein